jgi:hypothetical protein
LLVFLGCDFVNNPPIIDISVEDDTPLTGSTQTFTAIATDPDEDELRIKWRATAGDFSKTTGETVNWTAPLDIQQVFVTAIADDRKSGGVDSAQITLSVVNSAPLITDYTSSTSYINLGNSVNLTCNAFDEDGEDIIYSFFTSPIGVGTMDHVAPEANSATWLAPDDPNLARIYDVIVKVSDVQGYFSSDTLEILVFSEYGTIWIVDSVHRLATKYTSRGEKILEASPTFQKPVAVANNILESFGCYIADHDAGQIIKLDEKGETEATFSNVPNVIDLVVHQTSSSLWAISVSDEDPRLTVINTFTESVISSVKGLRHPIAVTINQNRGDVWIADVGDGDRIIRINAEDFLSSPEDTLSTAFATVFEGNFNNPTSLAIQDSRSATLYIADMNDDEVERLLLNESTGSYFRSTPVAFASGVKPAKVAVTTTGDVWVLSLDRTVQYFREDNTSQRTSIFSYLFSDPHTVAPDYLTGNVWIGDNGTHQVLEVSSADSVGVEISGFAFIKDLVINK